MKRSDKKLRDLERKNQRKGKQMKRDPELPAYFAMTYGQPKYK